MRRADRLFDIIQALRGAGCALTARELGRRLEVAPRTIYRDIALLQARRVPIAGEPGIGYVLRGGYDLPPLMLTTDEIEAVSVGLRMVHRLRDEALERAAETVLAKLASVVPEPKRRLIAEPHAWVSDGDAPRPAGVDLGRLREAIRSAHKIEICYADASGQSSRRIVRPFAMVYFVDATLVAAWCELRDGYRHFRTERIGSLTVLDERFAGETARLMADWLARNPLIGSAGTPP